MNNNDFRLNIILILAAIWFGMWMQSYAAGFWLFFAGLFWGKITINS